jgi:hypothetical protein
MSNTIIVNFIDFLYLSTNFWSISFVAPKTLKNNLNVEFEVIYPPLSLVMR